MDVNKITLTPDQARKILEKQARLREESPREIHNRPLREALVRTYLRLMLAGLWLEDGMPLRFDVNGVLRDGQHRLTALSRITIPGFSVEFSLVTNLAPESQMTMDQGAKRSVGDQLALKGIRSGNHVGSYFTAVLNWEEGISRTRPYMEVEAYLETHPADLAFIQPRVHQVRKLKSAGAALGAAIILCARVDSEAAAEFLLLLSSNGGSGPISTLYTKLRDLEGGSTGPLYTQQTMVRVIKAWNAWRTSTPMSRLVLGAKDKPGIIYPR